MRAHFSLRRLYFSLLWFALLAAFVSTLFFALLVPEAPNLKGLAFAGVLATILCSILFWWLLIVHPQRVTVLRGGLAGILSVVLALFLMFVIWGIGTGQIFQSPMTILFLGVLAMVSIATPLGWILMMIGASIGGLLAFFTRRWAFNNTAGEGVSLPSDESSAT